MFDWTFTRQDWEEPSYRVNGPAFMWEPVDTVVIHYPAGTNAGADASEVGDILRREHKSYLNNRGYSYGYNCVVDVFGNSWEVRGDTYKCAANKGNNRRHEHQAKYPGDPDKHNCNSHTFAIQLRVAHQSEATEPQLAEARRIISWGQTLKPDIKIVGHQDLDYTSCPGDGIYDQLHQGLFVPNKDSDIGEDMVVFRLKGYAEVVLVIDCVPMPLSQPLAKELGLWDEVQDAMKNPLPDHPATRAWLERVFGAPLTPTPSSV